MNIWGMLGAVFGFLSVAIGAFAAHGLKSRLSEQALAWMETGVKYQMYHALALLAVAWVATQNLGWLPKAAGGLFALGVLVFSGSLYLMAFTGQRWLGAITPLGGLAFLAGWIFLALSFR
jgi:uncharacterized membrane protein YgdD (TMEM256/DUF423 family)